MLYWKETFLLTIIKQLDNDSIIKTNVTLSGEYGLFEFSETSFTTHSSRVETLDYYDYLVNQEEVLKNF